MADVLLGRIGLRAHCELGRFLISAVAHGLLRMRESRSVRSPVGMKPAAPR
jgi:hypothetical protein